MRLLHFVMSVAVSVVMVGCHNHVFSPPARTLPLEGVATLGRGRIGLAVEGGEHGEMMGPSVISGTVRFRAGIADQVDLSAEGHLIKIEGSSAVDTHPAIYAVRLGAKYQPIEVAALTAGSGTGVSAGGSYVSPDLGFIVGYPNPYAAPFFSARAMLSIPVQPHSVDTTPAGEEPGTNVAEPRLTGGCSTALGLRIPIPIGQKEIDGIAGSLLGAVGNTWLRDDGDESLLWGWSAGGELTF